MTFDSIIALARDTPDSDLRAVWGTSPAATLGRNEKNATAVAMALTRLTATDIVRIARSNGVMPSLLLHGCIKD